MKKDWTAENNKFIREYEPKLDGSMADEFAINLIKFRLGVLEFDKWMSEVRRIATKYGYDSDAFDPYAWADYYNNGYSPDDAVTEDMSYAD